MHPHDKVFLYLAGMVTASLTAIIVVAILRCGG